MECTVYFVCEWVFINKLFNIKRKIFIKTISVIFNKSCDNSFDCGNEDKNLSEYNFQ